MADEEKTNSPAGEETTKEAPAEEAAEAPVEKTEEKKEVDTSNLSKDAIKVVEIVEKMAVLELSELVKVLEDKFGVSAAAPAMMMAGGSAGGEDAAAVEEKDSFDVHLTASGSTKISVIKAIRAITELGLKEAKDLVDAAPKVIKEGVKKEEAEEMKKKIEEAGGTVELK